MGEDRCAIIVQISKECWKVNTGGSWPTGMCICVSSYSPEFMLKYVCIIHDQHASYDMCACSVHMLNDI